MDINKILLAEDSSIKHALQVIDQGAYGIALVVDSQKHLLGTLTDGDIRRAFLNGFTLSTPIKNIYKSDPLKCNINDSKELIIQTAIKNGVYQIPIVNHENIIVDIENLASLIRTSRKKNKVILMAGGLGTRLKPLTDDIPKPLLKVGTKPILETIIESFANYGFKDIILCVNYKSDMIKSYFKDGSDFGVSIEYIVEDKRLGTAGALSLIENPPKEHFFVMNADLLTSVNFTHLLDFHNSEKAIATMCVREYDFQVPYGVIETKDSQITSIEEKPIHKFFVNAGIYVLSPKVFEYVPKNQFYDMPTLFETLINNQMKTISFPVHEYWIDIGRIEEFEKANNEYKNIF